MLSFASIPSAIIQWPSVYRVKTWKRHLISGLAFPPCRWAHPSLDRLCKGAAAASGLSDEQRHVNMTPSVIACWRQVVADARTPGTNTRCVNNHPGLPRRIGGVQCSACDTPSVAWRGIRTIEDTALALASSGSCRYRVGETRSARRTTDLSPRGVPEFRHPRKREPGRDKQRLAQASPAVAVDRGDFDCRSSNQRSAEHARQTRDRRGQACHASSSTMARLSDA